MQNLNNEIYLFLIFIFFVVACSEKQDLSGVQNIEQAKKQESVVASANQQKFSNIDAKEKALFTLTNFIKRPEFIESDWHDMQQAFPSGCTIGNENEIACPNNPSLGMMYVTFGDAVQPGVMSMEFLPPVSCDELVKTITAQYGAPYHVNDDQCAAYWHTDTQYKHGIIYIINYKNTSFTVRIEDDYEESEE